MPIDLASFTGTTLSFAVAISWNEAVRELIHSLRPPAPGDHSAALQASLAYALAVTLAAVLIVALADWGGRPLAVSSGCPDSPNRAHPGPAGQGPGPA
ncbi:MAG TPA: DUF5654 family protein [Elusimicrobiota bacterium]|jgi:hypothetical protein|nr:DUF5654 family protein [Elusimicrobiota bacterium]